jgi:hypothetical protein
MPRNNILVLLCWNSIRPTANRVLVEWAASDDCLSVYEQIVKDIQGSETVEQLVLSLAAFLCYQRLLPVTRNDTNQPIKGSYQADFDAILDGERLGNEPIVLQYMGFSILRIYYTVKDNERMRPFLAAVLCIEPPVQDPFYEFSDEYWIYRMKDGRAHKDAFKMAGFECLTEKIVGLAISGEGMATAGEEEIGDKEEMVLPDDDEEVDILDNEEEQGEEGVVVQASGAASTDECWLLVETQRKEDSVASPGVPDVEDRLRPFPHDVFHLDAYKLVYVCLPKVAPHENILSTISLPNGSSAIVVLRSYVPALERHLGTICFAYNVEPSREDVELRGPVEAQNQKIDTLARMAVDAILRDNTLEKGLWIYADPPCVLKLFTTWLQRIASQSESDSPAFLEPTDIDNGVEAGRIQLGGYDFNSYTLLRLSVLGHCAQTLDKLGNFDEILSIEELQDGSWELPVRKSYLPTLKNKLRQVVPGCIIEPDYDPTEPNAKEVEEFGYERARILRTATFHDRAERMIREPWPKAAAFYADLAMGGEREMVIL